MLAIKSTHIGRFLYEFVLTFTLEHQIIVIFIQSESRLTHTRVSDELGTNPFKRLWFESQLCMPFLVICVIWLPPGLITPPPELGKICPRFCAAPICLGHGYRNHCAVRSRYKNAWTFIELKYCAELCHEFPSAVHIQRLLSSVDNEMID